VTSEAATRSRRETRSRQDWIEAAWDALGEGGVEAVRVEALARDLGVTKGSFYWHFRDRQGLVAALLDRWFALRADDTAPATAGADPGGRIWLVFERAVARGTTGQAAALRFWAQRNPAIQRRIEAEDAKRAAFLEDRFTELGFGAGEAGVRAGVYMAMISAEFIRSGGLAARERLKRARAQHDLLTAQT
jgi:AcrR family transcriptional regulator